MGGALTLDDNPGGGSIFAFTVTSAAMRGPQSAGSGEVRPVELAGARALIIANSPFEAPAIAARLIEAGAKVARAEGLETGLAALREPQRPDLVIVDCALGPEATNRLARAARAAGAPKSLVLFSPFERRAFGQTALTGFDGWLVKPVRARSLFERLAAEFPQRPRQVGGDSSSRAPRRAARCWRRITTSTRSSRKRPCAVSASTWSGRRTGRRRCGSPRPRRRARRVRSISS